MIIDMSTRGTLSSACSVWLRLLVGVNDWPPSHEMPDAAGPEPGREIGAVDRDAERPATDAREAELPAGVGGGAGHRAALAVEQRQVQAAGTRPHRGAPSWYWSGCSARNLATPRRKWRPRWAWVRPPAGPRAPGTWWAGTRSCPSSPSRPRSPPRCSRPSRAAPGVP